MRSFGSANHSLREVGNKKTALCLIFLLLAGAEFVVRGPVRAVQTATQFNDFLSPYIQAKALIHGLDPYSPQVLLQLWPAEALQFSFLPKEVAEGTLVAHRGIPTAYPVTALVLLAPFSLLPWKAAYAFWLALSLVLFVVMLRALLGLAGFSYREPRGLLLLAIVFALAPFHTGIVTGNVTLIAVELSVVAIWTARQHREFATATLLAIATGLKPQIGLCFLFYFLWRRRWRMCGVALALLAGLAGIGLLRLQIGHVSWLSNYLNDNHVLLETGVLGNFTAINPTRFGLINLQVALFPFLGGIRLTNRVAMAMGVGLVLVWLMKMGWPRETSRKESDHRRELLELATIAVISLLPVYHRFYDASMLVLPLCWALVCMRSRRTLSVAALFLMLPFLIPGGTLLETMEADGRIPARLSGHWWWDALVMPHQVWMLLFLAILLLYSMSTQESSNTTTVAEQE